MHGNTDGKSRAGPEPPRARPWRPAGVVRAPPRGEESTVVPETCGFRSVPGMQTLIRRLGADTRYVLIGLPASLVGFALVVAGLAAGAGTAVLGVGLFVLAGTLLAARMAATVERNLLPDVLGRALGAPRYRRAAVGAGPLRAALAPLTCGQSWMDAGYALVRLPVSVASFAVVATWWAGALAGLTYPVYAGVLHAIPGTTGLPELLGLGGSLAVAIGFHTGLGLLFALTLPAVARAAAMLNAALAQAFLSPYAPAYEEPEAAPAQKRHGPPAKHGQAVTL